MLQQKLSFIKAGLVAGNIAVTAKSIQSGIGADLLPCDPFINIPIINRGNPFLPLPFTDLLLHMGKHLLRIKPVSAV